jgi:hypothetical protein
MNSGRPLQAMCWNTRSVTDALASDSKFINDLDVLGLQRRAFLKKKTNMAILDPLEEAMAFFAPAVLPLKICNYLPWDFNLASIRDPAKEISLTSTNRQLCYNLAVLVTIFAIFASTQFAVWSRGLDNLGFTSFDVFVFMALYSFLVISTFVGLAGQKALVTSRACILETSSPISLSH